MRILAWSWLLFLVPLLVGLLSGFSMRMWEVYAPTIEEAVANARLVRRIAIVILSTALYWRFAAGVTSRRLLHVLALFVLAQLVDIAFSLIVFEVPANELLEYWVIGRSFLAAMIGLAIAWLVSARSSTPAPSRAPT